MNERCVSSRNKEIRWCAGGFYAVRTDATDVCANKGDDKGLEYVSLLTQ